MIVFVPNLQYLAASLDFWLPNKDINFSFASINFLRLAELRNAWNLVQKDTLQLRSGRSWLLQSIGTCILFNLQSVSRVPS